MKENHKPKFLIFVIIYYRVLLVSFGGISWDQNGNIIKSKFWNIFGWFGCCWHLSSVIFSVIALLIHEQFKHLNEAISKFWIILIIWSFIALSLVNIIIFIIQKFGLKIIKIFMKYSLTEFEKLKPLITIWVLCFILYLLIFITQSAVYRDAQLIFSSFGTNLILIPVLNSISFVLWMVSTGYNENIKIVRKYLIKNAMTIRAHQLTHVNKFLLINYKSIKTIDQYLAFAFIFAAIAIVMSIMSLVYLWLFANKVKFIYNMIIFNLPNLTLQLVSLILNCFFNGKIFEETQNLLNDLDNLNINVYDNSLFKALILLRMSVNKTKCGFTIGGFAPWNKFTLLQVISCKNFMTNQFVN